MSDTPDLRATYAQDAVGSLEGVSDEWLMQAYLDGNRSSFTELVRRYEREVYSYLRRMVGDASLAEDVFQNTFLQVHLKRRLYEIGRPFRPWLYTIATHQAIDLLRRNQRHQRASLDVEGRGGRDGVSAPLNAMIADDAPEPATEAERNERRSLVRSAVERLADHLRVVVVLSYYQGMKYKEIAEVLRIPVGTVKSRLHAAVRRLGDEWKKAGLADQ